MKIQVVAERSVPGNAGECGIVDIKTERPFAAFLWFEFHRASIRDQLIHDDAGMLRMELLPSAEGWNENVSALGNDF